MILLGFTEKFLEGFAKNRYIWGEITKKDGIPHLPIPGAWTVCGFKRGLGESGGDVFEGTDTTIHTMGKVGGWGILRNGGDLRGGILKLGVVGDTPLRAMGVVENLKLKANWLQANKLVAKEGEIFVLLKTKFAFQLFLFHWFDFVFRFLDLQSSSQP